MSYANHAGQLAASTGGSVAGSPSPSRSAHCPPLRLGAPMRMKPVARHRPADRDHGGAAHAGHRLSVGPGAGFFDHRALHDRGSLRGRRRDRARRSRRPARRTRRPPAAGRVPRPHGRRSKARSISATSSRRSPTKLIRRHPHVFGDARDLTPDAVKGLWDRIKAQRKKAERRAQGRDRERDRRPRRRAGRPARPHPRPQAAAEGRQGRLRLERSAGGARQDPRGGRRDRSRARSPATAHSAADEVGDLLFAVVNLARHSTPIPRRCCARPTRNSSGASPRSSAPSPRRGKTPAQTRRSPRWTRCGTRPRRPRCGRRGGLDSPVTPGSRAALAPDRSVSDQLSGAARDLELRRA